MLEVAENCEVSQIGSVLGGYEKHVSDINFASSYNVSIIQRYTFQCVGKICY